MAGVENRKGSQLANNVLKIGISSLEELEINQKKDDLSYHEKT